GIRARTLQAQLRRSVELLMAAGTVLVLWYGARQVLAGALLPGTLLVFLAYLHRLYKPMRELAKHSEVMSRARVGLDRIWGVLETEKAVRDLPGARPAPQLQGRIDFEDVSFAYRPGEPVLRNINLSVEPGQVVGLVGSTGAGKTTLLSLAPRFRDPDRGRV